MKHTTRLVLVILGSLVAVCGCLTTVAVFSPTSQAEAAPTPTQVAEVITDVRVVETAPQETVSPVQIHPTVATKIALPLITNQPPAQESDYIAILEQCRGIITEPVNYPTDSPPDCVAVIGTWNTCFSMLLDGKYYTLLPETGGDCSHMPFVEGQDITFYVSHYQFEDYLLQGGEWDTGVAPVTDKLIVHGRSTNYTE